jgi:ABC-type transporter Mla subunit MlaD
MKIILLTLFLSLLLVAFFVVFFLSLQRRKAFSSSETDALLPFSDETPVKPGASARIPSNRN